MKLIKIYSHLLGPGVFLIDRIIKYLVVSEDFAYQINTGVSFSLLAYPYIPILLSLLALVSIVYLWRVSELKLSLEVVFFAGLSNFIDRIFYNGVIDYINVFGLLLFNFADVFISCALISSVIVIVVRHFAKKNISRK